MWKQDWQKNTKREARLVFNRKKLLVRKLLYAWASGDLRDFEKNKIRATCGYVKCLLPEHQECVRTDPPPDEKPEATKK